MGETAITVESLSTEYLRLFDEGWNPNLDEFLGRVPDEMREECRQRIEELAALNGLDLSSLGSAPAAEAAAEEPVEAAFEEPAEEAPLEPDLGSLSQITPDGDDASYPGAALDEAAETRKGRRHSKRRAETPLPEEPSSVHEGIEALAAEEPVEATPEDFPAQVEHTETEILDVGSAHESAPEPEVETLPRAPRRRDEPTYILPAQPAVAPIKEKRAPRPARAPARPVVGASDETQKDVLARLRDVSLLERQGAIPRAESDRLHVIYRRLLDAQGASEDLPITLPHLALYAFVAAAISGATLFVALVHDAAPALQALVPGAIFLTLLGAGIRARSHGDGAGAALFLAAGAIAAVPAVIAGLAIGGLMGGEGTVLPAPLSDLRLLVASAGGLVIAAFGLIFLRRGLFAWATAALAAAAYGSLILVLGVGDLAAHELALRFLPLVLLTVPGLLLESQGKVRWAMPFHLVAVCTLVGAVDLMALKGGLLNLLSLGTVAGAARLPYLGFAVAGLLLAVLSLALERARSFDLRRGARLLQIVAAIHLVGALGWNAAVNGAGRDVAALAGASVLLLVLGRFHRRPLLVAGGAGLVLSLGLAAIGGAMAPASFALALSGAGLLGALGIYFYLGRRSA